MFSNFPACWSFKNGAWAKLYQFHNARPQSVLPKNVPFNAEVYGKDFSFNLVFDLISEIIEAIFIIVIGISLSPLRGPFGIHIGQSSIDLFLQDSRNLNFLVWISVLKLFSMKLSSTLLSSISQWSLERRRCAVGHQFCLCPPNMCSWQGAKVSVNSSNYLIVFIWDALRTLLLLKRRVTRIVLLLSIKLHFCPVPMVPNPSDLTWSVERFELWILSRKVGESACSWIVEECSSMPYTGITYSYNCSFRFRLSKPSLSI